MLERYLANARQRFPTKSERERIEAMLDEGREVERAAYRPRS
jgi:hypothetical protein